MSVYWPSQSYRRELDIRLGGDGPPPSWIRPLVEGHAPNSAAWLVVMPRRAGKTWLAHGIAAARPAGTTVQVDLRSVSALRKQLTGGGNGPKLDEGTLLLVDEPALGETAVDPAALAAGLKRVRAAGHTAVVFASPAEHALLTPHLGPDGHKDAVWPPQLTAQECARMAAREPDWAPALVEWLIAREPAWCHVPFLLELVLQTGEENPELRADREALLRAAVGKAQSVGHRYIKQWFHGGLGASHRAALRAGRWRAAGLPVPATVGSLPAGLRLADDPVLVRHLPEVLRVHHISDLHHGGTLRSNVDLKKQDTAAVKIAKLAGAGTPMDSYLSHVKQLGREGRAPHLVIVTGDVVNRPHDDFAVTARAWLADLRELLAPHADLTPDDPRILLVGGNHDVSWDLVLDESPQARHTWFAANFADYPHPDLHLAAPADRRLYVQFPSVGLRFALLGSAESGGEAAREEVRELTDAFVAAGREEDEAAVGAVIEDFERVDPGVIARGVLDLLRAETGYVTVAAVHHPLSPVPAVEVAPYVGVVNAGQAKRALAAAATSLVLHGHTHQAFAAAERLLGVSPPWTIRITGAPALGSGETDEHNGYNELFVAREGGDHSLAVRTVRLVGGQWTAEPSVYAFRPGAADERDFAALCED